MPVLGASSAEPTPLRGLLIAAATLVLLSLPRVCRCTDIGQCTAALGMESGEIPDEDITASSMYDPSLGPKHASHGTSSVIIPEFPTTLELTASNR
ncbi:hypothetical protein EAI_07517 [Harpegnathos saltator]|uniref:Uncharacterized protein n=1 Tax=Harpegnathos saltator TaxID=610380 RepID=E2C113_HARSA|nr:hypothetical protein EAI_07517 [Harpegnathos saltator]